VTSSDRHLMHETLSLRELRLFPIGYACGGRLCCVSLAPPKFQCSRDIVLLLAVIAHPLKNPTTRHQSITPRLSNPQTPSKGRLSVEQPNPSPKVEISTIPLPRPVAFPTTTPISALLSSITTSSTPTSSVLQKTGDPWTPRRLLLWRKEVLGATRPAISSIKGSCGA